MSPFISHIAEQLLSLLNKYDHKDLALKQSLSSCPPLTSPDHNKIASSKEALMHSVVPLKAYHYIFKLLLLCNHRSRQCAGKSLATQVAVNQNHCSVSHPYLTYQTGCMLCYSVRRTFCIRGRGKTMSLYRLLHLQMAKRAVLLVRGNFCRNMLNIQNCCAPEL